LFSFLLFLEGKHLICPALINSTKSLLVFGSGVLQSRHANSLFSNTIYCIDKILKLPLSSFNIVQLDSGIGALSELGIMNNSLLWGDSSLCNLYSVGMCSGNPHVLGSYIAQNTHGTKTMINSDGLLASTAPFESESLLLNGEGRVQISKGFLEGPLNTRVDYKLFLGMTNLFCYSKHFSTTLKDVRTYIDDVSGLLLNRISYNTFCVYKPVPMVVCTRSLLVDFYSTFYQGGGVSVFSNTMVDCLLMGSKIEFKNSYNI